MLKIGILGLGNNGSLHMLNCLNMKDIDIIAVADKSKRKLNNARSYGIKNFYNDYHDLIVNSPDLDAVIISLPNALLPSRPYLSNPHIAFLFLLRSRETKHKPK